MKKLAIAGASIALAAMPVVGVLAADGNLTTIDTVQVTIDSACSLTASGNSNAFSANMNNGQLKSDFGNTTMSIVCNDVGGWKVTAIGNSNDISGTTTMVPTGDGTAIATGTATEGATSNWAMKVTGTGATGFTDFAAVPGTAAIVATQNAATATASLTTTYQVYISPTQQADTYTGKVLYTLVHPAQ